MSVETMDVNTSAEKVEEVEYEEHTVLAVAPRNLTEGEEFELVISLPKKVKKKRGRLAGIPLSEMNFDQLKIEKTNAYSVWFKAKQAGASEERIAKCKERLDAVNAIIEPIIAEKKAAKEAEREAKKAAKVAEREAKKAAKEAEKTETAESEKTAEEIAETVNNI